MKRILTLEDAKYFWYALLILSVISWNPVLVCGVLIPSVPFFLFKAHSWAFNKWQMRFEPYTVQQTMWATYCLYFTPLLFAAATIDWRHIEL